MTAVNRTPLHEKFEAKIRITPGCWIWTGAKDCKGYGKFSHQGKRIFAHRLSYSLYVAEIPAGKIMCHACDNPSCVNPDHLWPGTDQDNANDKMRKGRWVMFPTRAGEAHPLVDLTADQVYAIRADGRTIQQIAAHFGMSASHINSIKTRFRWSHLPERAGECKSPDGRTRSPKLTLEQQLLIRSDDRVQTTIAADYGVSQAVISKIKLGVGCYAHLN